MRLTQSSSHHRVRRRRRRRRLRLRRRRRRPGPGRPRRPASTTSSSPPRSASRACRTCRSWSPRCRRQAAAGRRRARHQGPAVLTPGLTVTSTSVESLDHRPHPRRRHRRRQPRPGILGRRRDRRRLPPAQRRRLRRPGRAGAHRGAEGPARHPVRQEHLGRRHQHHHQGARPSTSAPTAKLTAGNYDALGGSASVTGPLIERQRRRPPLRRRAASATASTTSITGVGPRTETEDNDQDFYTVRGQLLFMPNDDARIRVIADYTKRDENCCAGVQIRTGPTAAVIDALARRHGPAPGRCDLRRTPFARIAYANRDTDQDDQGQGRLGRGQHRRRLSATPR